MNIIDNLTIKEARDLAMMFNVKNNISMPDKNIGRYCVIRTYSAGVHVGILSAHNGQAVELGNARRIWNWNGANTLHEISLSGIIIAESRLSETVESITLTQATEIIPCTPEAEKNLREAKWKK